MRNNIDTRTRKGPTGYNSSRTEQVFQFSSRLSTTAGFLKITAPAKPHTDYYPKQIRSPSSTAAPFSQKYSPLQGHIVGKTSQTVCSFGSTKDPYFTVEKDMFNKRGKILKVTMEQQWAAPWAKVLAVQIVHPESSSRIPLRYSPRIETYTACARTSPYGRACEYDVTHDTPH